MSMYSSGGSRGGVYVPPESPFADTDTRDDWASANLELLRNGRTQIVVLNIPAGDPVFETWGGETNPSSYEPLDWIVGSQLSVDEVDARIKTVAFDPADFSDGQLARFDQTANRILPASATETETNIDFSVSGKFPAGSVWIGEVYKLSDMGAGIGVTDSVDNVKGLILHTRWDNTGDIDTRIPNISATANYSQPLFSETITRTAGNSYSWQPPVASIDLVQTQVTLKSVGVSTGFSIEIRYGSSSGPLLSRNVVDLVDGDNVIPLDASITRLGMSLYITYNSTSGFTLRGATVAAEHLGVGATQFVPYYVGVVQTVTYNDIGGVHAGDVVTIRDVGGGTTGLQSLDGRNLYNIPQSAVNTLSTDISTINSSLSSLDTRLDTAESDIDTLQTNVSSLTTSVAGKATAKKRYVDYNANDNSFSSKETIYEFTIDGSKETISSAWQEWRKTGISSCSVRLRIEYGDYGNSAHNGEIYFSTTATQSSSATYQTTLTATGTAIPNEEEVPLKVTVERTSGGDLTYSNRFRAKISDK